MKKMFKKESQINLTTASDVILSFYIPFYSTRVFYYKGKFNEGNHRQGFLSEGNLQQGKFIEGFKKYTRLLDLRVIDLFMSDMHSSTALNNILVILRGPHCCSVVSKKETCVSLYWINKKAHSKGFSWTCVHRVIYYISAEKAKQNHFKTTTFLHFPT